MEFDLTRRGFMGMVSAAIVTGGRLIKPVPLLPPEHLSWREFLTKAGVDPNTPVTAGWSAVGLFREKGRQAQLRIEVLPHSYQKDPFGKDLQFCFKWTPNIQSSSAWGNVIRVVDMNPIPSLIMEKAYRFSSGATRKGMMRYYNLESLDA